MSKCIVTGGAGFIGSHIVDRLVKLGYEVIVIDNLSADCNDKFYYNVAASYYEYDVCDYENTRKLYENCKYVFHLAAEARLQNSVNNPIKAVEKNTLGTCVVLQCVREAGVNKVIYSSTSSAYGNNPIPNNENQPDDCLNAYSVSKVAGEKLCKMYTELYGLKTIIFRYFNVYGERAPSRGQYSLVTGIFLRQNNANEPLTIVGNGSQRRDFIYVGDIVDANILAAVNDVSDDMYGQVYNIGSGTNTSVMELANVISENKIFIEPRIGEAEATLADIDKVYKSFGWKPKTNIISWIKNQLLEPF
jgi:UDP-glucose 4-epimerase